MSLEQWKAERQDYGDTHQNINIKRINPQLNEKM